MRNGIAATRPHQQQNGAFAERTEADEGAEAKEELRGVENGEGGAGRTAVGSRKRKQPRGSGNAQGAAATAHVRRGAAAELEVSIRTCNTHFVFPEF